jgi:hypothetical protein
MAWPSGTKASTTNCDQPSDLIANARADIKQNIDNVNDVIDTFAISTPTDGDLLRSTGKFEQVAASAVSGFAHIVSYGTTITTTDTNNIAPVTVTTTLKTPANSDVSVVSNNLRLTAGTWFIESNSSPDNTYTGGDFIEHLVLYDDTGNESITSAEARRVGGTTLNPSISMERLNGLFTLSSTSDLVLYGQGIDAATESTLKYSPAVTPIIDSAGSNTRSNAGLGLYLKIVKIA